VTQRAGDAHARQPHPAIDRLHLPHHAHDRVEIQRQRRLRVFQVNRARHQGFEHLLRQRVHVHLEPQLQRRHRVQAFFDHLVHVQAVGPLLLVSERVEAEDVLSRRDAIVFAPAMVCIVGWATVPSRHDPGRQAGGHKHH
jgi:hypothetical protein